MGQEGLFLADETYKLMYEFLRQTSEGMTKGAMHLDQLAVCSRQMDSDMGCGRALVPDHMIVTLHGVGRHMGNLHREGCKCVLSKTIERPFPSFNASPFPVHKPSQRVGGVGHNIVTVSHAYSHHKLKS